MTFEAARTALRVMPVSITLMLMGSLALIIGNAATLWMNLQEIEAATAEINETWAVIDKLRSVRTTLSRAESSQRGYLLTNDASYLSGFVAAKTELPQLLGELERTLGHNTRQRDRYVRVHDRARAKIEEMEVTLALYARDGLTDALGKLRSDMGERLMGEASDLLSEMETVERNKLKARNNRSFERFGLAANVGLVIGAVTLLILLLFYGYTLRNVMRRQEAEGQLRAANETLEAKVVVRTAQLSHLSRHLLQMAESEKATLANELHDELGSHLTAINLDVTSVATHLRPRDPALAARLERALKALHETVDIKRKILQGLRPSMLDSLGLCAAMRMHCEEFTRLTGIACAAECPDSMPEVESSLAIALYRVAQESLNNIAKYARAKQVRVVLQSVRNGIHMQISDDGVGIDPDITEKPMAHGILGMRERIAQLGGTFTVQPGADGSGTVVDAFVPLPSSVQR
jgi:signal transduction histidine kinase